MVTDKGLWQTSEAGKRLAEAAASCRISCGASISSTRRTAGRLSKKTVVETHDGGRTWEPLPRPNCPGDPSFAPITGSRSPTRSRPHHRLEPAAACAGTGFSPRGWIRRTREPARDAAPFLLSCDPRWRQDLEVQFGIPVRRDHAHSLRPAGPGLGLIEYPRISGIPSEAYKLDRQPARARPCYRDKAIAMTDIWLTPDGTAYLAGIAGRANCAMCLREGASASAARLWGRGRRWPWIIGPWRSVPSFPGWTIRNVDGHRQRHDPEAH